MGYKPIRVLFCGARKLGIDCLKLIQSCEGVEIVGAVIPRKTEKVWWKDIVDEDEVNKLEIPILNWEEANKLEGLDIVFSVLYGGIFKKNFIEKVKYGIINLHPAPLPEYRGCNSYAHAILNGDKEYGVTLHYVDEGIDTGNIIGQLFFQIDNRIETGKSLYKKAQTASYKLFSELLPEILSLIKTAQLKITSKTQSNNGTSRYYKRDSLTNKRIQDNWNREMRFKFVRALYFPPFEPAYLARGKGKKKKVYLIPKGKKVVRCQQLPL